MDRDKERQEISLIGRLLSMEALLVVMGMLSLVSGILAKDTVRLLLGLLILAGLILLIFLRRSRRRNNGAEHKDETHDA
jgi:hypothetical protein